MFKILTIFFCSFGFLSPLIAKQAPQLQTINCAPQLQPYLLKILQVPEARMQIASIQQEGLFDIEVNDHQLSQQFGAFWDVDHRTICINLTSHSTEGEVIGSIVFELQNAASNARIESIDRAAMARKIDRDQYVESIEYMEYENSLKAATIAKKGIALGVFPQDALLHTYKDFEEHYYYQKVGGHSIWVAKNYDGIMRDLR